MADDLRPLAPGATVGILGGGQLGRMMAMAAAQLGFETRIYTDKADAPATQVTAHADYAPFDDGAALDRFASHCDVVTFEFENVPAAALAQVARSRPVFPPIGALEVAQDRLREKEMAQRLGIGTAPYAAIDKLDDLTRALSSLGRPALLKTRRMGYDGKGQVKITGDTEPEAAYDALASAPAIVERFVNFTQEISVIVVRGQDGTIAHYDPAENRHDDQILRASRVPAGVSPEITAAAIEIANKLAEHLQYVGVLAVELFVTQGSESPELLLNEIAPRVHNSGHWTLGACQVSQFENHIRAVVGWPLGPTSRHSDAVMTNLIGDDVADWHRLASDPAQTVHIYGKGEARAGRKMGHVTQLKPKAAS